MNPSATFRGAPVMWRFAAAMLGVWLLAVGCSSTPQSTRLTGDDYDYVAVEMAAKLRSSGFLADRGPDSERMQITLWKVTNLTSDIINEGDQWWFIYKLYTAEPLDVLAREKNIRFTIRADRVEDIRRRDGGNRGIPVERNPSHVLSGTFESSTRMVGTDRTEVYLCAFSIEAIDTGEIVWQDYVEFKRAAGGGLAWD